MDTDHTYISMEAEWLPEHDECDDHDDKAILKNIISSIIYGNFYTESVSSTAATKSKIYHEAITTAAASLASYHVTFSYSSDINSAR